MADEQRLLKTWLLLFLLLVALLSPVIYSDIKDSQVTKSNVLTEFQKFEYFHDKNDDPDTMSYEAFQFLEKAAIAGDPQAVLYIADKKPKMLYTLYLADEVNIERFHDYPDLYMFLSGYTYIHTRPSDYINGLDALIDSLDTKYRNASLIMIDEIFDRLGLQKERYVWQLVIKSFHADASDGDWRDYSSVIESTMSASELIEANTKVLNTIEMIKTSNEVGLKSLWLAPLLKQD